MIEDFLTGQATQVPQLTLVNHLIFIALLLGTLALTNYFYTEIWFIKAFKFLQMLQLISLYTWYMAHHAPLAESLPLYHCRIAMFGLLFLPDSSLFKRYLALLGVSGSVLAFAYPVLDPFPLFHLTTASFILGHLALLANSLGYLYRQEKWEPLSLKFLMIYTLSLNSVQLLANAVTGGNYGFLNHSPVIHVTNPFLNFCLIGLFLVLLTALADRIIHLFQSQLSLYQTKKSSS